MNKLERQGWRKVGVIGVDAGLCWVGDPCYILDTRHKDLPKDLGKNWNEFVDRIYKKDPDANTAQFNYEHGYPGLGVCVSTGYGDGTYNVYVKYKEGRVMSVMVDFEEVPEED